MLVHGSGVGGAGLVGLARLLDAEAPDLPGYPGGQPPEGDALTTDAEAIEALIGEREVALFGHSYGGRVALEVACRARVRLTALAVYEPVVLRLLQVDPSTVDKGPETFVRTMVDYWAGEGAWATLPEPMRQLYLSRAPRMIAEGRSVAADSRTSWPIAVPCLVLYGDHGHEAAERAFPALAAALGATEEQIAGDHMAPVTRPALVADVLRRFYSQVTQGSTTV